MTIAASIFVSLIGVAVAFWVGFRLGPRMVDDSGPCAPEEEPSAEEAFNAVQAVRQAWDEAAHPRELADDPRFQRAVTEWRESHSSEALFELALSNDWGATALVFETLGQRTLELGEKSRLETMILGRINALPAFVSYFALRALDQHVPAPESLMGKVLARLDESWAEQPELHVLEMWLRRRLERGESSELIFEPDERVDPVLAEALRVTLEAEGANEPTLAALLTAIQSKRDAAPDLSVLRGIGRVWQKEELTGLPMRDRALEPTLERARTALDQNPARSVVFVGEAGAGKTAIARLLLAERMEAGFVIFEASAAALMAGQSYIGQLEERLKTLFAQLEPQKRVVWYIPDFADLALAGRHRYNTRGILDQLLPVLIEGRALVVGEARATRFTKLQERHPQLRAALDVVPVTGLNDESTLRLATDWIEREASVNGGQEARSLADEALALSGQFLAELETPGRVMELLRLTVEKQRLTGENVSLTREHLLDTLAMLSGLPLEILDETETLDLDELHAHFASRIIGQPEAVDAIVERITVIKAALTDPSRPQGVFLLAGPTGTGKTELAKTLARFLFGSAERMIRFDMSEYQTADSLNTLLGDAYGEHETLVDRIRKTPFAVVLLDEFEKAHPRAWDLFLQVFDDGRLTDRRGMTADFRHAIILLTSNVGAGETMSPGVGFSDVERFTASGLERELARTFRPEFINRLDRVIVFRPFSRDTMRAILWKELGQVFERRGLRHRDWAVEWDPSAIEFLLTRSFTSNLGARPLRRAIERELLTPLARLLVQREAPEGEQFLLIRAAGDALDLAFVDPDGEPAADDEPAPLARDLAGIVFAPQGHTEELRQLEGTLESLRGLMGDAALSEMKGRAMNAMGSAGFWEDDGRFEVLHTVETLDRMEAGLDSAERLLKRLIGRGKRDRYNQQMVGDLASLLFVLEHAIDDAINGRPQEAFLTLREGPQDARSEMAHQKLLRRRLLDMYRGWAKKRRMSLRELVTDGVEEPVLAVTGFGALSLLAGESGIHVWEEGEQRLHARVCVWAQPIVAPGVDAAALVWSSLAELEDERRVVRRYRAGPAPLVRDAIRGWRSGHLERVLAGDFDVIAGDGSSAETDSPEGARS